MCGIAGFYSTKHEATRAKLERMLRTIVHRGPDSLCGFLGDGVGIGSARLSIVDIPGGRQPAVSKDRKVAVAFNGEIFNYLKLRDKLRARGARFRTRSEVETLLQLYLEYGESFVEQLNGQFAIAIWDGRSKRLLLFRDRLGIRPLFWHGAEGHVVFASEAKALFAYGGIERRLDRAAIHQTFRFWTMVGDTAPFEGVRQVPPAHFAVFDRSGVRLHRYWDWPFPGALDPIVLKGDEDYFEAFREQLDATIARQKMADIQVASYLSGGVDSSVIAMRLQQQVPSLRTYSVAFEDKEYDESEAQRLVADHFGLEHISLRVKSKEIGENFPRAVWHAETPLFRTAPVPLFLLSQRVHEDGIKVVMTGEGADEVLLGYDLFRETAIRRFWQRNPESEWRASLFKRLYAYLPQYRNPRYFGLLIDFYRSTLEDTENEHFAMAVRWNNGRTLEQYFSADMKEWSQAYDPELALNQWLPDGYSDSDDIDRAQITEVMTLLSNYLLSSQGDRMSMAHAVEGRYPYLDHEFMEFAARLPRRIKLRGLRDKFILRQAFGDALPKPVRDRPKVAYQAPDIRGFFVDGWEPDYLSEILSERRLNETGLFDAKRVALLLAKARSQKLDRVGNRDNMAFVLVLSTMLLDDIFVRGANPVSSQIPSNVAFELV